MYDDETDDECPPVPEGYLDWVGMVINAPGCPDEVVEAGRAIFELYEEVWDKVSYTRYVLGGRNPLGEAFAAKMEAKYSAGELAHIVYDPSEAGFLYGQLLLLQGHGDT